jgi:hypothetical protein
MPLAYSTCPHLLRSPRCRPLPGPARLTAVQAQFGNGTAGTWGTVDRFPAALRSGEGALTTAPCPVPGPRQSSSGGTRAAVTAPLRSAPFRIPDSSGFGAQAGRVSENAGAGKRICGGCGERLSVRKPGPMPCACRSSSGAGTAGCASRWPRSRTVPAVPSAPVPSHLGGRGGTAVQPRSATRDNAS